MLTALKKNGFIFLENQSLESFNLLSAQLGKVVLQTEVKVKKNATAMVQTSQSLEWHQDSPEARWILWFCITPGKTKEETTELFDSHKIINTFTDEEIKILSNIQLINKTSDDQEKKTSIISQSSAGESIFYFCPWLVASSLSNSEKSTIEMIKNLLKKNDHQKEEIFWKKNDILVIDNHRMLHRRPQLESTSERFLIRNWVENGPNNE